MTRKALSPKNNFLQLEERDSCADTARVILLSAPFEQTTTYGKGACAGPDAVLKASHQVELFDCETGRETFRDIGGIATLEPILCENAVDLCDELEKETAFWLKKNRMVVTAGGEHSSVVGAVKAYCSHIPELTVLQLDAHSDLRNEYQGSVWNHACAARRILDFHSDIVQAGIRSQEIFERQYAERHSIPVFYAHQIARAEYLQQDWTGSLIDACKRNVYITCDCDVMDPSVIPATGTPEPGGLTWFQINRLFERLTRERCVVGFDICELAPFSEGHHSQYAVAKLVYRLLGFISKNREMSESGM